MLERSSKKTRRHPTRPMMKSLQDSVEEGKPAER